MDILSNSDYQSLVLALKLAAVTTVLLLLIGTPMAWFISLMKGKWKAVIEALVALPLVLPPTVLGLYLLIGLGPNGLISGFFHFFGMPRQLSFTFTGLAIGSFFYSLPFTIRPLVHAFESIPKNYLDAAKALKAGPVDRFFSITIPLSKPGFLTAGVLSFAHTIGEFGVVLMIGGNIPGKTRVVSIDIFNRVEALEYTQAHILSAILFIVSFIALVSIYGMQRQSSEVIT